MYVEHWEGRLAEEVLASLRGRFLIRQSSVVISELRRGARTRQAVRLVQDLRRLARFEWTPSASDWWKAAVIIEKIGDGQSWDRRKRQEFQNDALIALSAQKNGATVITANRGDFALLAKELKLRVLFV